MSTESELQSPVAVVGAGFLGRRVAAELAQRYPGRRITATTRSGAWDGPPPPRHVKLEKLDVITDSPAQLTNVLAGSQTLVICFAPGRVQPRNDLYVRGTARLLEASGSIERVVYVSSTSALPDREGWLDHRVETERYWASPNVWNPELARAKGAALFDHGVDPAGTTRQYLAVGSGGSRDEALAQLDVPTLVIHGSADTLIPPANGRHAAEVIPGARYVEIDGLGHDLPPTYWARIVAEI